MTLRDFSYLLKEFSVENTTLNKKNNQRRI